MTRDEYKVLVQLSNVNELSGYSIKDNNRGEISSCLTSCLFNTIYGFQSLDYSTSRP